jgi:cytochrome c oxidase subunit IV
MPVFCLDSSVKCDGYLKPNSIGYFTYGFINIKNPFFSDIDYFGLNILLRRNTCLLWSFFLLIIKSGKIICIFIKPTE